MFWVYVLQSERNGRFYIGYAGDVEERLKEHNAGKVKATRYWTPFRLAYQEPYLSATEARKRERYLKNQKSHRFIEALVGAGSVG